MLPIEALLQPVATLMLLTAAVALFLMCTRVLAMKKLRVHPQKGQDVFALRKLLPHSTNRVANNYNHLFEQPVLFYVVTIGFCLLDKVDTATVTLAWCYVAARVIHTLIQTLWDRVMVRFGIFILSWFLLGALILKLALIVFTASPS